MKREKQQARDRTEAAAAQQDGGGAELSGRRFFFSYLRYHRRGIFLYAVFCGIFAAVFALYHLPVAAVVYPSLLCGALGLAVFWRDSRRLYKDYSLLKRLETFQGSAEELLHMLDALPEPESAAEAGYQAILRQLCEEQAEQTALLNRRYREMIDYYTVWVHQIKTPIAAIRLNLQNEDSDFARLVAEDLQRIEQYVEMVMAFLRLDSESTDYVFRACDLDGILRQAVRKFAAQFIRRGLTLTYEPVGATVITDEKWLCFVVEQLLSNALKYTRTGGIRIGLKAPKTLCIRDTGIGIAPEDLPRIFEKGYTGYNGRTDKKASGLGLYLCRRVCENLGYRIWAESEPGRGTSVLIDLSQEETRPE